MADQGNGTGQESGTGTGAAGQEPKAADQQNGGTNDQGQAPGQGGAGGQEFDPNTIQDPAVKAYLEKVQADAEKARQGEARYRTELRAAQQAQQEATRANETAEQTAERERQERDQRLTALERENRDLKVGVAVREAALKANAFNPATVYATISDRIEVGDDGKPTNVEALLKDLKASDPYLFKRTTADAGAGNGEGNRPAPNMNDAIRGARGARPL